MQDEKCKKMMSNIEILFDVWKQCFFPLQCLAKHCLCESALIAMLCTPSWLWIALLCFVQCCVVCWFVFCEWTWCVKWNWLASPFCGFFFSPVHCFWMPCGSWNHCCHCDPQLLPGDLLPLLLPGWLSSFRMPWCHSGCVWVGRGFPAVYLGFLWCFFK